MVGAPAGARLSRAALGVIGFVGVAFPVGAYGAEWRFAPHLSVQESFSDNANLAADNEDRNSDFITRVSPGLSLNGQGGRSSVNLDYSNNQNISHRGTQSDSNSNSLAATGQVEVWDRIAFIDASASISQVVENTDEARSNSIAGENINRTEARAFSVSPSFRHHFGPWVETLSRISFNSVTTDSDVVENNKSISESVAITSGRRFTRVLWGINAQSSKTQNSGDEAAERNKSVNADGTLVLNRKLSLIGGVGWQKRESSGLNSDPIGLTWNAGISAQPTPRTSLRLTYGHQDDTNSINFQGTHQLSPRTTITASYSESIETSQQQIANNLAFLVFNPVSNRFEDSRTGQAFGPNDSFGLEEDTFRQKRFSLSMNGSRQRNTFSVSAFAEERDIEAQGAVETVFGGALGFSRRLTPRASGNVNLSYRATDFGTTDDRTEDQYDASAGFNYRVRNDIQATLTYNFTLRAVNNAPTPEDTYENSVTLGLTKSF